ncbi:MAG: hypothetical protein PHU06_06190 [Gallionella sp.]|nr:hypothetical protein [Gallionella sp.]
MTPLTISDLDNLKKGVPMGDLDNTVARHGVLIETIVARAVEDRALNESKFRVIDDKLNTADAKLDRLLESQQVAAGIRADIEKRADARAKRLVVWASIGSGGVIAVLTELVRWWLRKHGV